MINMNKESLYTAFIHKHEYEYNSTLIQIHHFLTRNYLKRILFYFLIKGSFIYWLLIDLYIK